MTERQHARLTERQHARLERYIRRVADGMGLRDWRFMLERDLTSDDVDARIRWPFGQRYAEITLGEPYFEASREEQRETVVHELLHCHFAAAQDAVSRSTHRRSFAHFMQGLEYGIDATAAALAPRFPLPPV